MLGSALSAKNIPDQKSQSPWSQEATIRLDERQRKNNKANNIVVPSNTP